MSDTLAVAFVQTLNDNRSHQPCGLRRSTCRWYRLACCKTSGCMHVWRPRFATPRGLFWLAFDWCKQVKQVARSPWQLKMADGKSTRLNEHQRSRNRPPKSKKKVSLPSWSRSGLQRLRMLAFFFGSLRAFELGERLESLFSYLSPCQWLREASP